MKKHFAFLIVSLFLLSAPATAQEKPLRVVASFSILADIARNVGGPDVEVTALVGPDADAHAFEPTPQDIKTVAGADLVIVNGLGFEGWMDRLAQASGRKDTPIVASQGIEPATMAAEEHDHGHKNEAEAHEDHEEREDHEGHDVVTDPHAWQDIANVRTYIRNIEKAFAASRPALKDAFKTRADAYDAQLAELDIWIHDTYKQIPAGQRKVITSHDAFGYYGHAYGVTFLAPEGLSTESEPTAADVARLSDRIKAEGIRAVFIENMTNGKLVTQLAKDTGANVGGTLYADALSGPDGPAPTYIGMMLHNTGLIAAGLQGKK